MDDTTVDELCSRLRSSDARARGRSADEVTDVLRSLNGDQAGAIATVLVEARLTEIDRAAQEAQLNALAEMNEVHELPRSLVDRLRSLPRPTGDPSQDEHVAYLLDR